FDEFAKYVHKKIEVNNRLFHRYEDKIFRKYKWYGYINRQKSDTKLVKSIREKYGRKCTICMGDWSIGKQMNNFISTPNIRIKRLLGRHFKVYNVDEYRTSILSN